MSILTMAERANALEMMTYCELKMKSFCATPALVKRYEDMFWRHLGLLYNSDPSWREENYDKHSKHSRLS